MRIIVSSIPEAGLQQEIKLPVTLDNPYRTEANLFIKVYRVGRRVLVEGSVEASALLECSRCLKEFLYPLNTCFKEEYLPTEEIGDKHEHELTDKELETNFYSNDEINVEDIIREQMLLSIPMKPLCKSECQGICPKCGMNLNKGLCECKGEEIDHRLIPLKKFKKSLKTERSKNGKPNT